MMLGSVVGARVWPETFSDVAAIETNAHKLASQP